MRAAAVVALLLCASCAALVEPSGTGNAIVDPTTGEQREETKGDVLIAAAQTAGSVVSPQSAPLIGVAGIALTGLIGALASKRKQAA